jgi:hypothetical protein
MNWIMGRRSHQVFDHAPVDSSRDTVIVDCRTADDQLEATGKSLIQSHTVRLSTIKLPNLLDFVSRDQVRLCKENGSFQQIAPRNAIEAADMIDAPVNVPKTCLHRRLYWQTGVWAIYTPLVHLQFFILIAYSLNDSNIGCLFSDGQACSCVGQQPDGSYWYTRGSSSLT